MTVSVDKRRVYSSSSSLQPMCNQPCYKHTGQSATPSYEATGLASRRMKEAPSSRYGSSKKRALDPGRRHHSVDSIRTRAILNAKKLNAHPGATCTVGRRVNREEATNEPNLSSGPADGPTFLQWGWPLRTTKSDTERGKHKLASSAYARPNSQPPSFPDRKLARALSFIGNLVMSNDKDLASVTADCDETVINEFSPESYDDSDESDLSETQDDSHDSDGNDSSATHDDSDDSDSSGTPDDSDDSDFVPDE